MTSRNFAQMQSLPDWYRPKGRVMKFEVNVRSTIIVDAESAFAAHQQVISAIADGTLFRQSDPSANLAVDVWKKDDGDSSKSTTPLSVGEAEIASTSAG